MDMWQMFVTSPGTFFEMWLSIIGYYALKTLEVVGILIVAFYVIVCVYNVYLHFQPAMTLEELDGPV